MSFWITLLVLVVLFTIAECLRPRPDVEEPPKGAAGRSVRVKTGLSDSRMAIVPDGEVWAPGVAKRGQPNASPCTWCGAALRLDKRGNCVNCGGEVL